MYRCVRCKVDAVKNEVEDLSTRLETRDKERKEQVGKPVGYYGGLWRGYVVMRGNTKTSRSRFLEKAWAGLQEESRSACVFPHTCWFQYDRQVRLLWLESKQTLSSSPPVDIFRVHHRHALLLVCAGAPQGNAGQRPHGFPTRVAGRGGGNLSTKIPKNEEILQPRGLVRKATKVFRLHLVVSTGMNVVVG